MAKETLIFRCDPFLKEEIENRASANGRTISDEMRLLVSKTIFDEPIVLRVDAATRQNLELRAQENGWDVAQEVRSIARKFCDGNRPIVLETITIVDSDTY
jgi:antitoxin component of RelBE/YafQ-DinJ toxin-antitoxin module